MKKNITINFSSYSDYLTDNPMYSAVITAKTTQKDIEKLKKQFANIVQSLFNDFQKIRNIKK